jgi:hypothetical protein
MADVATYFSFPIKTATEDEVRLAVTHGKRIHQSGDLAFYSYGGVVYVTNSPDRLDRYHIALLRIAATEGHRWSQLVAGEALGVEGCSEAFAKLIPRGPVQSADGAATVEPSENASSNATPSREGRIAIGTTPQPERVTREMVVKALDAAWPDDEVFPADMHARMRRALEALAEWKRSRKRSLTPK